MARHIDADALHGAIDRKMAFADVYEKSYIKEMVVDEIPTADVAPVVHGKWVDSPNITECVVCSNCMSDNLSAQVIAPAPPHYKYCPNCGAKMDLKG